MTRRRSNLVEAAPESTPDRVEGAGPFASRLTWRLPAGGEATLESRAARKRGAIAVRDEQGEAVEVAPVPDAIAQRLRRVNWVAAGAFTVGGSLFALGAAEAQLGSGDATTAASIYFAGGLFFNTGGYASLLGAINAPRSVDTAGAPVAERWRWWSYEPQRIDWLSTFALFVGTLAFGVSLGHSFLSGLTHARGQSPDLDTGDDRLRAVPDLGASRVRRAVPSRSALPAEAGSRLVDRGHQPTRLDPVHGLGDRGLHQAGDRKRDQRGDRQLGHAHRGPLLRRRGESRRRSSDRRARSQSMPIFRRARPPWQWAPRPWSRPSSSGRRPPRPR